MKSKCCGAEVKPMKSEVFYECQECKSVRMLESEPPKEPAQPECFCGEMPRTHYHVDKVEPAQEKPEQPIEFGSFAKDEEMVEGKPEQPEWEKEFDLMHGTKIGVVWSDCEKVKDFIRSLLQEKNAEVLEDLKKLPLVGLEGCEDCVELDKRIDDLIEKYKS